MSWPRALFIAALLFAPSAVVAPLFAQRTGSSPVLATPPAAAQGVNGHLDPDAATRAYLATLPRDVKARSDAYNEGVYWLTLWDILISSAVFILLLATGVSSRMRDRAERFTRVRMLQNTLYWAQFVVVVTLLTLPWAFYETFVREHSYSLSNLTFAGWMSEQGKGFLLALVLGTLFVAVPYAFARHFLKNWWKWGAAAAIGVEFVLLVIGPIVITPIFNSPTKLADARIVEPILRLARQNGIATTDVWEIDASKQSKRINAFVSGGLGTERITLNDNLLNRASLPEIEAVMGHEMGHYVMNHVYKGFMQFAMLTVIGFALIALLFERLRARYEVTWKVRAVDDIAGIPLFALLFGAYFFVITPVTNTLIRTQEYEADLFGLNTARQPDGFAQISVKLAETRKLEPGAWEERIFYDHPSGRTRIYTAMRWKAENIPASSEGASRATTPSASSASGSP
ncbi:MAG: M48 family metallopeptidase [Gemmatimonadota bacterium]